MLRTVTFLFAILVSSSGLAQQALGDSRTLICKFGDQGVSFVVEADLKTDGTFFGKATFTADGIRQFLSLSQKQVHKNQKYRFVVNEERPSPIKVIVFKTPGEHQVATATLLGLKPHPRDVPGHCVVQLVSSAGLAQKTSGDTQTLMCEFKDKSGSFVIEAHLKADGAFFGEATLTLDGVPQSYSLSQEQVHGNRKYRFVINEENPSAAVRVVVFKTPDEDLVSTATLLGVKPHPQDVPGYCNVL